MKNFISSSIALFLLLCVFQVDAQKKSSGKLFVIGGGKRSPELVKRMIDEANVGQNGYVVILPMSSTEPDSAVFYSKQQFQEQGISKVFGINFIKGETPSQAKLDSVRNAKLIYISGGDQNLFMGVVGNTPIEKAILDCYASGGMIAGTSAGAAVMSEKMVTGNELKYKEYEKTFRTIESDNIEIKRGLALITTAIIDQHFVVRSRHNRLISAAIEYPGMKCIGIDESTAILVKDGKATVVGDSQVLVFVNTSKKRLHQSKLGSRKIRLEVLLPGDIFKI